MATERERGPRVAGWELAVLAGALALGAALRWPALATPRYLDDHAQLAMIEGAWPLPRAGLDVFAFARRGERAALVDTGLLPWWTDGRFSLSMGRPLASALARADHAVFGRGVRGPHVHSLVWWALAVSAAAVLLRAALPRRTAAVATVLYALDAAHTLPVAWLANRSVLVATFFGLVGTIAHVRWREQRRAHMAAVVTVAFGLSALAGEYAASSLAYVLAWELIVARDPAAVRLRACLPAVAPVALVFGTFRALGYGASGSGQYIDPLGQPQAFALAAAGRMPALLADAVLARAADGASLVAAVVGNGPVVGVAALVALVGTLAVVTRAMDPALRRRIAWLLVGGVMALVPVLPSIPSSRLLVASGVGFAGALAVLVVGVLALPGAPRAQGALAWAARGACLLAAVLHLGVAPWRTWTEARFVADFVRRDRAALVRSAPPAGTDRMVVLAAGDPETLHYPTLVWREEGLPVPARWAVLSMTPSPLLLVRLDANTLDLRSLGTPMLTTAMETMYRAPWRPLAVGQPVRGAGLVAEVMEREGGYPRQVRFRFDRDLDAPGTLVVVATANGLVPLRLPPVRGGTVIPPPGVPGL